MKYIKTVISYQNFNDYIPKLISIVKKYICFFPESRNDIIELFNSLLKPRHDEMNFYLSSMSDLIHKYDESIIPYLLKWRQEFNFNYISSGEEEIKMKKCLKISKKTINLN